MEVGNFIVKQVRKNGLTIPTKLLESIGVKVGDVVGILLEKNQLRIVKVVIQLPEVEKSEVRKVEKSEVTKVKQPYKPYSRIKYMWKLMYQLADKLNIHINDVKQMVCDSLVIDPNELEENADKVIEWLEERLGEFDKKYGDFTPADELNKKVSKETLDKIKKLLKRLEDKTDLSVDEFIVRIEEDLGFKISKDMSEVEAEQVIDKIKELYKEYGVRLPKKI